MKIMTVFGEEEIESFKCIHCKETLPIYLMSTDKHHIRRCECKPCRTAKARIVERLKRQYASLKPSLEDKCVICQRTGEQIKDSGSFTGKRGLWTLDHEHKSDKFRGWICQHCNNGLSGFRDNIESMKRAILYVEGKLE
jgi:hypothetical protein